MWEGPLAQGPSSSSSPVYDLVGGRAVGLLGLLRICSTNHSALFSVIEK